MSLICNTDEEKRYVPLESHALLIHMATTRRTFLQTSAVSAAATQLPAQLLAQQVNVPTCPTSVPQPTPEDFKNGPMMFRQIPEEPLATKTPPAHWNGTVAATLATGPSGIAKEFGPSTPDGATTEYLDDDDMRSATLRGLMDEQTARSDITDYYEIFIQQNQRPIQGLPNAESKPTAFLGYGCYPKASYAGHQLPDTKIKKAATFPGPMFQARVGKPMVMRFVNEIEDYMSVHLHGGHGPAHSDGHPAFVIPKAADHAHGGTFYGKNHRDYYYPHTVPAHGDGTDRRPENLDYSEAPSTMWYHDHSMDVTGPHVQLGLAGFFPSFDDHELRLLRSGVLPFLAKTGYDENTPLDTIFDEAKTNPLDLCLVLQDRCFAGENDPSGADQNAILYSVKGHNGFLGHRVLVNGQLHPQSLVYPTKYRMRFLNGSNARIYKLALYVRKEDKDGNPVDNDNDKTKRGELIPLRKILDANTPEWFRIGKDTWLYPHAIRQHKVLLGMATRADMIVDFQAILETIAGDKIILNKKNPDKEAERVKKKLKGGLKTGERIAVYLCNLLDQESGRGPGLKLPDGNAQERTLGANGQAIAIAPARDVLPDGDTNRAELGTPWPLMKFTITETIQDQVLADAINAGTTDKRHPKFSAFDGKPASKDYKHANVQLGTRLREHVPILPEEIRRTREVVFERGNGIWQINGKVVDEFLSNFVPELNTAECWILENGGGGWWHPIHIHLESHQQIEYLEELEVDEFKLVIGQIISIYDQALTDEVKLGYLPKRNELQEILRSLKETLAPVDTRIESGQLVRAENDEVSLQKLTKEAVKKLENFARTRRLPARPTNPDSLKRHLRLQKAYGPLVDLIGEFAPEVVFEDHRLWSRISIPEWDKYKSDTTLLGPNTRVKIFMKFRTFDGPFVFHCHNLEHEDMRMMFVFDPRPTPPQPEHFTEAAKLLEVTDPEAAAAVKQRWKDEYHDREHVTRYRHPWRFDDDPDFDELAHKDEPPPGTAMEKKPGWNSNPPATQNLARAHPIWGGWDQHL